MTRPGYGRRSESVTSHDLRHNVLQSVGSVSRVTPRCPSLGHVPARAAVTETSNLCWHIPRPETPTEEKYIEFMYTRPESAVSTRPTYNIGLAL